MKIRKFPITQPKNAKYFTPEWGSVPQWISAAAAVATSCIAIIAFQSPVFQNQVLSEDKARLQKINKNLEDANTDLINKIRASESTLYSMQFSEAALNRKLWVYACRLTTFYIKINLPYNYFPDLSSDDNASTKEFELVLKKVEEDAAIELGTEAKTQFHKVIWEYFNPVIKHQFPPSSFGMKEPQLSEKTEEKSQGYRTAERPETNALRYILFLDLAARFSQKCEASE